MASVYKITFKKFEIELVSESFMRAINLASLTWHSEGEIINCVKLRDAKEILTESLDAPILKQVRI